MLRASLVGMEKSRRWNLAQLATVRDKEFLPKRREKFKYKKSSETSSRQKTQNAAG